MKKLLFFFVFSIFTANAAYKPNEFSLKNGMKVIMIERKSVPIISLSVWYKCGSKCDRPFRSGVAHFLEHLAFLNHKQEFSDYLDEIGAEQNAFTSVDTICFYEIFPKDCLEKVLFFESKRMRSLEIEPEVFLNEKRAILEERGMRIDSNVQGKYLEVFLSNVFNRQVGGVSVIGWKHEMESIEIEDLKAFYRTWIVPNNATIILVGDFKKSEAEKLIKKYFEDIPSAELPQKHSFKENCDSLTKSVECKSAENGSISKIEYTYKVPFLAKNNLRKSIALLLALEILEQPSSFINVILKQMTDAVSDMFFSYTESIYEYDVLNVIFHTNRIDNLDEANENWQYFRKKIVSGCISEAELQKIKRKELIALAYKKEDVELISNFFGQKLMSGLSVKEILSLDDVIQSITVKECNDILKEVFSSPPIATLKTLPKGFDRG